jgi:hypothetical protein
MHNVSAGLDTQIVATVAADSDLEGDVDVQLVNSASMVSNSSFSPTISLTLGPMAVLTADSEMAFKDAPLTLAATLRGTSAMIGRLSVIDGNGSFMQSNSSFVATASAHYNMGISMLRATATVTANVMLSKQHHVVGTVGGNSNAQAIGHIPSSQRPFQNSAGPRYTIRKIT